MVHAAHEVHEAVVAEPEDAEHEKADHVALELRQQRDERLAQAGVVEPGRRLREP